MHWWPVALVYVSYLALASIGRRFARARNATLTTAALSWIATIVVLNHGGVEPWSPGAQVVVPSLILLLGYWLSGLFFTEPDHRIERWLQGVDETLLTRTGVLGWFQRAPHLVAEYLELSYVLVYVMLPAGAVTLLVAGRPDDVTRFWATVLAAEFACYGMLPWIPTRPPRSLEAAPTQPARASHVRRLNMGIASRASIQVNTLPSGHAAGAVATALCVATSVPQAGASFAAVAASIVVATVIGRYHYLIDSVLGVLVGAIAWALLY